MRPKTGIDKPSDVPGNLNSSKYNNKHPQLMLTIILQRLTAIILSIVTIYSIIRQNIL